MKIVYKHFRFPKVPLVPALAGFLTEEKHGGRHGVAYHYQRGESKWTPDEKGGYTRCFIYNDKAVVVSSRVAECSPLDAFCYKIGRDISRGRALKALE